MDTFEIGVLDARMGFKPLCVFEGTPEEAVQVACWMETNGQKPFWRKCDDNQA